MGTIVINQTDCKQNVVLQSSLDGISGGYYDASGVWHDLSEGTEPALYPMETGIAQFTSNYGNTVVCASDNMFFFSSAKALSTSYNCFLRIDPVTSNSNSADSANGGATGTPIFVLPAGSTVKLKVKASSLVVKEGAADADLNLGVALRDGSTSVVSIGTVAEGDNEIEATIESETNITHLYTYVGKGYSKVIFEIELTVNGDKWI